MWISIALNVVLSKILDHFQHIQSEVRELVAPQAPPPPPPPPPHVLEECSVQLGCFLYWKSMPLFSYWLSLSQLFQMQYGIAANPVSCI